jgi:hypothetical protein
MDKPKCRLTGEDGNAFAIIGRVIKALQKSGQSHLDSEFQAKTTSGNYDHLLAVCLEYVDDIGSDQEGEE